MFSNEKLLDQVHYAKELDKPDNSTTLIVETTDKKWVTWRPIPKKMYNRAILKSDQWTSADRYHTIFSCTYFLFISGRGMMLICFFYFGRGCKSPRTPRCTTEIWTARSPSPSFILSLSAPTPMPLGQWPLDISIRPARVRWQSLPGATLSGLRHSIRSKQTSHLSLETTLSAGAHTTQPVSTARLGPFFFSHDFF